MRIVEQVGQMFRILREEFADGVHSDCREAIGDLRSDGGRRFKIVFCEKVCLDFGGALVRIDEAGEPARGADTRTCSMREAMLVAGSILGIGGGAAGSAGGCCDICAFGHCRFGDGQLKRGIVSAINPDGTRLAAIGKFRRQDLGVVQIANGLVVLGQ